jgi:hypothetical protein
VPAKVVLDLGGKPAQVKITIGARNNKSGVAVPVLYRNFLHEAIGGKSGKDADPRGVPCKKLAPEYINVVVRNCHVVYFL